MFTAVSFALAFDSKLDRRLVCEDVDACEDRGFICGSSGTVNLATRLLSLWADITFNDLLLLIGAVTTAELDG